MAGGQPAAARLRRMPLLTEEPSWQNYGVYLFIALWFVGWTVAARQMYGRANVQRREMMQAGKDEIERLTKEARAAQKKKD